MGKQQKRIAKKVRLVSLTAENLKQCLALEVNPEQEYYVASNRQSLAKAAVNKSARPFLIMDGETAVGFVMFNVKKEKDYYEIWRFMIDQAYQGCGYGKAAMRLCMSYLKAAGGSRAVLTCIGDNEPARQLYRSYGFVPIAQGGDEIDMAAELI
ncbi:MAG: GNAT family N-acetyltransferase [Negativicutes bacterium]|nr:GNAT family N-acetyltransferase [Negativicutes bacterium]